MERLKKLAKPNEFTFLKVIKTTLEFIRFEGELDDKTLIPVVISRLDTQLIKLSGYQEPLKIKAAETKSMFPSRHDWDTYFRDAKNMDEMKPGERPDTIYFKDLPTRWFSKPSAGNRLAKSLSVDCEQCQDIKRLSVNGDAKSTPLCQSCMPNSANTNVVSEVTVKEVMQTFGVIRRLHIPSLDPVPFAGGAKRNTEVIRSKDNKISKMDISKSDILFDAYIQYDGYISFCRAMNSLKNMKLMLLIGGKALTANIIIDFDKTKHMSDRSVRRRKIERERYDEMVLFRQEKERVAKKEEQDRLKAIKRKHDERQQMLIAKKMERKVRRDERSTLRKDKRRERKERSFLEDEEITHRIQVEERRILIANRKLETIRLLPELFDRVKVDINHEEFIRQEKELEREKIKNVKKMLREKEDAKRKADDDDKLKKQKYREQECKLRNKILHNVKAAKELSGEKKKRKDLFKA